MSLSALPANDNGEFLIGDGTGSRDNELSHLLLVITPSPDACRISANRIRLRFLRHSDRTESASPATQLVRRWSPGC